MAAKKKKIEMDTELTSAPNKWWSKFLAKKPDLDTVPVIDWSMQHLILYFTKRYEQKFGVTYSFKFTGTPSKCYEIYQMKRLAAMLAPDSVTLKEYIDWVFDTKVTGNKTFRVIGFLANDTYVSEFKFKFNRIKAITRATMLPPRILQLVQDCGIENVNTYGDLAFLWRMVSTDADSNHSQFFEKLMSTGFDSSALERVK